ncbi:hypothetical protein NDU88_007801 [Pleurodeles waltl]|uniref:Uncharacterized protein n=1 Tax=Pleurodeles waltl TaxID=8319 RepID=A0AAV7QSX0_PLEWA|nr:hypothetical protein NDU88_007801 [Pleurodeles waltl]
MAPNDGPYRISDVPSLNGDSPAREVVDVRNRGSLVQSGCPEVWIRSYLPQPERYYRGTTSGPAAGAVVKTGTSPVVHIHASLPAAVVDVNPVARQPACNVQSGRAANGSNSRRMRDSASGPVVDVAADAGPKLAAHVSGRPQAVVTSTAAASQDLARGAQSGCAVRILNTARSADPGQQFKEMPATHFQEKLSSFIGRVLHYLSHIYVRKTNFMNGAAGGKEMRAGSNGGHTRQPHAAPCMAKGHS